MTGESSRVLLALTQGDPAGVGPEILLRVADRWSPELAWTPILIVERAALEPLRAVTPAESWKRLAYLPNGRPVVGNDALERVGRESIPVLDPVATPRSLTLGEPGEADARASLAALDRGLDLVVRGVARALVTAPVGKAAIARYAQPDFRGHTDYLADKLGDFDYGRDYLMSFLGEDLRVALLSTHLPLREAISALSTEAVVEALVCLDRGLKATGTSRRRLALAGLNPHAGEGGLLGDEEQRLLEPAVVRARSLGIDVAGPESPDTVFFRARKGEFDWVLALYHDQGLIAIKTLGFGTATNWTLGLPILRTSVDHGTAYAIAGRGEADAEPMWQAIQTTLGLIRDANQSC